MRAIASESARTEPKKTEIPDVMTGKSLFDASLLDIAHKNPQAATKLLGELRTTLGVPLERGMHAAIGAARKNADDPQEAFAKVERVFSAFTQSDRDIAQLIRESTTDLRSVGIGIEENDSVVSLHGEHKHTSSVEQLRESMQLLHDAVCKRLPGHLLEYWHMGAGAVSLFPHDPSEKMESDGDMAAMHGLILHSMHDASVYVNRQMEELRDRDDDRYRRLVEMLQVDGEGATPRLPEEYTQTMLAQTLALGAASQYMKSDADSDRIGALLTKFQEIGSNDAMLCDAFDRYNDQLDAWTQRTPADAKNLPQTPPSARDQKVMVRGTRSAERSTKEYVVLCRPLVQMMFAHLGKEGHLEARLRILESNRSQAKKLLGESI